MYLYMYMCCGVWNHPDKNGLIQAHKETKLKQAKDTVIGYRCLRCMQRKPMQLWLRQLPWPQAAVALGYYLLQKDQVYCLAPEAPLFRGM